MANNEGERRDGADWSGPDAAILERRSTEAPGAKDRALKAVTDVCSIPPEQRCYCGWWLAGECPHCPKDKTCADKMFDRGNALPSSVCECVDAANRAANVKSALHPPVLTELYREEGEAKLVESADSNASLPDWPVKDSLTGSKENLNLTEPVADAIARDPKAFTELLRGALQHASESNDLHVSIPTWALDKILSGGWNCMLRELTGRDVVLRALRNLRPRVACPRWAAVSDGFGLGSTYSQELCRNFGLDPNEQIGPAREDGHDSDAVQPSISFGEGKKIYDQGWNDGCDAVKKILLALAAKAGGR